MVNRSQISSCLLHCRAVLCFRNEKCAFDRHFFGFVIDLSPVFFLLFCVKFKTFSLNDLRFAYYVFILCKKWKSNQNESAKP